MSQMLLLVAHQVALATDVNTVIAAPVKQLVVDSITVMEIVLPLVVVFRIIYRFAEDGGGGGKIPVLVAEVVMLIFLSFAIGTLLKAFVTALP
jgi:hypothetical protein